MSQPRKSADRHKGKPFLIRLKPEFRQQLERLAKLNASNVTSEINAAIREHLKRAKLWPPA